MSPEGEGAADVDVWIPEDVAADDEYLEEERCIAQGQAAFQQQQLLKRESRANSTAPLSSPTPFSSRKREEEKESINANTEWQSAPRLEYISPTWKPMGVEAGIPDKDKEPSIGVWIASGADADEAVSSNSQLLGDSQSSLFIHQRTTVWADVERTKRILSAYSTTVAQESKAPPVVEASPADELYSATSQDAPIAFQPTAMDIKTESVAEEEATGPEEGLDGAKESAIDAVSYVYSGVAREVNAHEGTAPVVEDAEPSSVPHPDAHTKDEDDTSSEYTMPEEESASLATHSESDVSSRSAHHPPAQTRPSNLSRPQSVRSTLSTRSHRDYGEEDTASDAHLAALLASTARARSRAANGSQAGSTLDDTSSTAGSLYVDVAHPHNFALQLLTHDLRSIPAAVAGIQPQQNKKCAAFDSEALRSPSSQLNRAWVPGGSRPLSANASSPSTPKTSYEARRRGSTLPKSKARSKVSGEVDSMGQVRQMYALEKEEVEGAGSLTEARKMMNMPEESLVKLMDPPPSYGSPDYFAAQINSPKAGGKSAVEPSSAAPGWTTPQVEALPTSELLSLAASLSPKKASNGRPASAHPSFLSPGSDSAASVPQRPSSARPSSARPSKSASLIFDDVDPSRTGVPSDSYAQDSTTAAVHVTGVQGAVSVYMADSLRRVAEANRWSAALGRQLRYRLDPLSRSMAVDTFSVAEYWGDEALAAQDAPTLSSLPQRQFLKEYGDLKERYKKRGANNIRVHADERVEFQPRIARPSTEIAGAGPKPKGGRPTSAYAYRPRSASVHRPRSAVTLPRCRPPTASQLHSSTSSRPSSAAAVDRVTASQMPRSTSSRPSSAAAADRAAASRPASARSTHKQAEAMAKPDWEQIMNMCGVKEDPSQPWGWALIR